MDSDGNRTIFTDATIKKILKDGTVVEIKENDPLTIEQGTEVIVQYKFELPNQLKNNIKMDDYFKFELPDIDYLYLEEPFTADVIASGSGEKIGEYTTDVDGKVNMVFNGAKTGDNVKGGLQYRLKVDTKKTITIGQHVIKFPYVKKETSEVPIYIDGNENFRNKRIKKEHVSTSVDQKTNIATMNWKILVNPYAHVYLTPNMTLKDKLTAGDPGNGTSTYMSNVGSKYTIKNIRPVKVDIDGNILPGDPLKNITGDFKQKEAPFDNGNGYAEYDFVNNLDYAYEFEVETVLNQVLENKEIYNQAVLTGDGTTLYAKAKSGYTTDTTWIKKTGKYKERSNDKDIVSWEVIFNEDGKSLENPVLKDSFWEGGSQELKLLQETLVIEPSKYQSNIKVNTRENGESDFGFDLEFIDDINETITIKYDTEVIKSNNNYVENIVRFEDLKARASVNLPSDPGTDPSGSGEGSGSGGSGEGSSSSEPIIPSINSGVTKKGLEDVGNKTLNWDIELNRSPNEELTQWILEDILKLSTMNNNKKLGSIDKNSLEVIEVRGQEEIILNQDTDYDIEWIKGSNEHEEKFKITYPKKGQTVRTRSVFKIRYNSEFNVENSKLTHINEARYQFWQDDKTGKGYDSANITPIGKNKIP